MLITLAGANGFGTQAAGEFLTTPEYRHQFEQLAPAGWERKNLQIVLETKVIREIPGPPAVVGVHVW